MDPQGTKLSLQLVLDRCTREAVATKSPWNTPKTDKDSYFETINPKLAAKIALAEIITSVHVKGKLPTDFKISWFYDKLDYYFEAKHQLDFSKAGAFEKGQDDLLNFLKSQLSSLLNVNAPEVGD